MVPVSMEMVPDKSRLEDGDTLCVRLRFFCDVDIVGDNDGGDRWIALSLEGEGGTFSSVKVDDVVCLGDMECVESL